MHANLSKRKARKVNTFNLENTMEKYFFVDHTLTGVVFHFAHV